jgi:hypothetical protein
MEAEQKLKSYQKMTTQTDQIRYEFTNQDTIVLRRNGIYHKAIGNSAVILKHMGVTPRIRLHYDNVVKQERLELAVHAKATPTLREMLKAKGGVVLREDENIFVIRLKQPLGSKEIRRMRNSAQLKSEVTEGILTKNRPEAPLEKEVREIFGETVVLVRQMPVAEGAILGRLLLETALRLHQVARELTRDEKSPERRLALEDAADDLRGLLFHVSNFIEEAERVRRIGRSLKRVLGSPRVEMKEGGGKDESQA